MNSTKDNPYIGPQPFQESERERFFGREQEANELLALALSEQEIVFYAQSGAGKSSLINTCLIPDLKKKGFEVLLGRVGGDTPAGLVVDDKFNIFVFNLLRSLSTSEVNLNSLTKLSLSNFLVPEADAESASTGRVSNRRALIIDQFEEIFSRHHEAWEKRKEFFEQLAEALEADPRLRVILVMREDYIASLDPYANILPNRLRMRYFMQRLEYAAALKAVTEPVKGKDFSRPYEAGAAEKLVNDLRTIKVIKPDGTSDVGMGQFVEPLYLQVICYDLWKNLPEGGTTITRQNVQDVGDVSTALMTLYANSVERVAKAENVSEAKIRKWFTDKLISPTGIRNMVLQEPGEMSANLENRVIQALSDLVRAEQRGGAVFYELTHDRLAQPIIASNRKWFDEHLSPLQKQAALWNAQGQADSWLVSDQALAEVEEWAKAHPDELTDIEKEFLNACRKMQVQIEERHIAERRELEMAQKLADEQSRSAQRSRRFSLVAGALFILALIATLLAFNSQKVAQDAKRASDASATEAIEEKNRAEALQKLARSSELATIAIDRSDSQLDLAILLGLQANSISNTFQTRKALLTLLQKAGRYRGSWQNVRDIQFNPNSKSFAILDDEGLTLWDLEGNKLGGPFLEKSKTIDFIVFNPDGQSFAVLDDAGVTLWDLEGNQLGGPYAGPRSAVYSTAFSPDGKILASSSKDGSLILWDGINGEQLSEPLTEHSDWVNMVAIDPDGKVMASASDDQSVILWDISNPKNPQMIGNPITGFDNCVASVVFGPDEKNKILASSQCGIGDITIWNVTDPKNPQEVSHFGEQTEGVYGLAFSPDGSKLASVSLDGTIVLWDISKQDPLKLGTMLSNAPVYSVDISPDGKILAAGNNDGSINIWDISHPQAPQQIGETLEEHSETVNGLRFNPNGSILASVGFDGKLILWDTANWTVLSQPSVGVSSAINSVTFSPTSNRLATSFENGSIILWDVSNPKVPVKIDKELHAPLSRPDRIEFSTKGNFLTVSISTPTEFGDEESDMLIDTINHTLIGKGLVKFEDPNGKFLIYQLNGDTNAEQQIYFFDNAKNSVIRDPIQGEFLYITPDEKFMVYQTMDENGDVFISLWDVNAEKRVGTPTRGDFLALNQDSKTLVYQTFNDYGGPLVIFWDIDRSEIINTSSTLNVSYAIANKNGTILAIVAYDIDSGNSEIYLYEISTGKELLTEPIKSGDNPVLSTDGQILLYSIYDADGNPTVTAWDIKTGIPIGPPSKGYLQNEFEANQVFVYEVFDYDMGKNIIHIIDTSTNQEIATQEGTYREMIKNGEILIYEDNNGINLLDITVNQKIGEPIKGTYLAISQDGQTLLTRSETGAILFWDLTRTWPLGEPIGEKTDKASRAVLSLDGETLAWIGEDGIVLQSVANGAEPGEVFNDHFGNEFPGAYPSFSPDGKRLAIGDRNTSMTTVWDLTVLEQRHEFPGNWPAFSPNGRLLAIGDFNTSATMLWDLNSLERIGSEFPGSYPSFSSDGRLLAVGDSSTSTTTLWNLDTLEQIGSKFPGIWPSFSPDGKLLAIGDYKIPTTTLWDLDTREQLGSEFPGYIPSFSPDGKLLAIGDFNTNTIKVWDMDTLEQFGSDFPGTWPAFSPDNALRLLAIGDYNTATTTLWDLYTRKQIGSEFPTYIPSFSPDGRLLAIGTETTSTTTIWDLTNRNQPDQLTNNHAIPPTNIVFSSDGKTLASLASDGIVLRNLDDNTSLHLETGEYTGQFTNQMSFYADDKRFVALADDGTLVTWDASTGELTIPDAQPLKGSDTGLSTFSPGGKYLVYESDNHLSIWDVMESKPSTDTVEIPENRNSAGGITFSQDGTVLAYSDGETITLYDFPGLSQIGKLSGGLKGIINVGLIMDTNGVRYLITLDESGYTQIWDWVTRTKIGDPMAGNLQFVGSITQNGGVVYIDSTGRLIKFDWGLDHVTWQRRLCPLAGRNFTQEEWKVYFPADIPYPTNQDDATCPQWPLDTGLPAAAP